MVGETLQPVQTTTTGTTEQSKTAFIKVYQDAGVIGVAMITMLALCVLMALFSSRLLKMYASLTTTQAELNKTYADAIDRITKAVLITDANIKSATAEIRREHDEQVEATRRIVETLKDVDARGTRAYDLIIQALTGPRGVALSPTPRGGE